MALIDIKVRYYQTKHSLLYIIRWMDGLGIPSEITYQKLFCFFEVTNAGTNHLSFLPCLSIVLPSSKAPWRKGTAINFRYGLKHRVYQQNRFHALLKLLSGQWISSHFTLTLKLYDKAPFNKCTATYTSWSHLRADSISGNWDTSEASNISV